ncbi:MAG: cytochrome c biogenesis protein CcsA [Candidatus Sulfotelmatobacter sp.]
MSERSDLKLKMKRVFPILAVVTAALLAYALYQALVVAPTDAQQGDVYRIIYYHVPSAWTAFLLFFINFVASIQYLVSTKPSTKRAANWVVIAVGILGCVVPFVPRVQQWLHATGMYSSSVATTAVIIVALYFLAGRYFAGEKLDVLAVTTAEVGVVFCTIVLVTGPIWARPVWGIWWAPGDIRLTSTLVLWLIYVSYLILRRFSDSAQTQKLAAVLAIFGALDVPLVYFSIWFFRTQHPQPVIGGGGSIDPKMLHVLMISWTAFLFFAFLVCWSRYRLEMLRREVEQAHAMQSLSGDASSVAVSNPAVSSPAVSSRGPQ